MTILINFFEPEFQKHSKKLHPHIREKAKKAFENLRECDPSDFSRGLNLEKIQGYKTLYSIRIDDNYRALGNKEGNAMYWKWIGPHNEYIRIIKRGQL